MTLQQLIYFVEMAHILHYTNAAKKLNIAQPSLSYALSKLADTLGVSLFKKSGQNITLTKYGEAFLPYAENALNILKQGEIQINSMKDPSRGNINLGYIYSVGFNTIPYLVSKFYTQQGHRNIHFDFHVNTTDILMEKLMDGTMDVLIAPLSRTTNKHIKYIPMFEQELYLIVYDNHHLAKNKFINIDDLKNEEIIIIDKKTDLFDQTSNLFKNNNIILNTTLKVDECNSMAAFIGAQLGIGIMPKMPLFDKYNIKAIPFEGRIYMRTIYLIWNNIKPIDPNLDIFIKFLKKTNIFDIDIAEKNNNQET